MLSGPTCSLTLRFDMASTLIIVITFGCYTTYSFTESTSDLHFLQNLGTNIASKSGMVQTIHLQTCLASTCLFTASVAISCLRSILLKRNLKFMVWIGRVYMMNNCYVLEGQIIQCMRGGAHGLDELGHLSI